MHFSRVENLFPRFRSFTSVADNCVIDAVDVLALLSSHGSMNVFKLRAAQNKIKKQNSGSQTFITLKVSFVVIEEFLARFARRVS